MLLPGERAYRVERAALVETLESLTEAEFDKGETLCEGWAPRDVLAHLLGIDAALPAYAKAFGNIRKGNAAIVEGYRHLTREQLLSQARSWADSPAMTSRLAAGFLLGDLAIHHQDILRALGRTRQIPDAVSAAILRESVVLGGKRLLSHRLVPTDGGRPIGRGLTVTGTREALGMWLSGRTSVAKDLSFGS